MTNPTTELNVRIAEYMGWREVRPFEPLGIIGFAPGSEKECGMRVAPDYTSSQSPRYVLDEVEKKVIAEFGSDAYALALNEVCGFPLVIIPLITATAEQRCRAIALCLEGKVATCPVHGGGE